MSSFGSQWRNIRHFLSLSNLNVEVEKLVQKLKPSTPEQWDNLITKFEEAVSTRITSSTIKEIEPKQTLETQLKNTTVEDKTLTKPEVQKHEVKNELEKTENSGLGAESKEMSFEGLLRGLRLKKDLHFGKISEQQWKAKKPTVSKASSHWEKVWALVHNAGPVRVGGLHMRHVGSLTMFSFNVETLAHYSSIHSRTTYVISAIVTAESTQCLAKRTGHFVDHLLQYPESRDYAIKEGAIRVLLRVQKSLRDGTDPLVQEIKGIVSEALALLGYAGPTKGPGPNILAIDGGGIRGIIAIEILRHLEKMTGRKVTEMFDFIVGVSTGAIIASVIGSGVGNLETASDMYHNLSKKMFGNTSLIGGASRLVWSQSYYDTDAWEKLLQENLGDRTLSQCNRYNTPKMALVSCAVMAGQRLSPYVFRTYCAGYRVRPALPGASAAKVWTAVRASAAAPTYFNEFRDTTASHQDGGIMVNNPTGVAIHEAKVLFGAESLKKACIISVGTGRALNKHGDYNISNKDAVSAPGTSWKEKFNMILDSATDTESTHLLLNDLLPPGSYYRFNPPLMQECAMDEIDPAKLNNLVIDTHSYIRRNQYKFEQAAAMLVRKRSIAQRIADYVEYQGIIMGIVQSK